MLKILVALGLGAAILLQASAFVATKSGELDHDSAVASTVTQSFRLGTVSGPNKGPAQLLP
jgi:hypothetical protein